MLYDRNCLRKIDNNSMKIGIFGGTGLDDPEIMTKKRELRYEYDCNINK